jgi:AraC family L-rhamnose operon transcriptional activator RhaR
MQHVVEAIKMTDKIVYRGERYFRDGEAFALIRHAEALKQNRVFHSHDFVEICYVCSGSGFHVVGDEEYSVSKGDLFLINYDITHTFYRESEDVELVTYNILFKPGFLDESLIPFQDFSSLTMSYLFKQDWEDNLIREDLRLNADEQKEFDQLIAKMQQEYEYRQAGFQSVLRACMIELIIKIMRGFSRKSSDDVSQQRRVIAVEEAVRYLDQHYFEQVSLSGLAKKSFFSKNYFAQLFKESTGMTISQYTQQARIEKACKLIRESESKLTQIALEVGYSDYKAFYLAFRKQMGISPGEYGKR